MSEPALQLDDFNNQDLRDVADRLLETTKVEYVDEGVLLIMNPPGIEHRRIVHTIIDAAKKAYYTGQATVNWETYETYQWEFADGTRRYFIPDIEFIYPDAVTAEEERAAIALIVEVTSPTSRDAGTRVRRPYAADRARPPARSAAGSRPRHRHTAGDPSRLAAAWHLAAAGARWPARRPGAALLRRTRPPRRRDRTARCRCAPSP